MKKEVTAQGPTLYRAPYVVPVTSPLLIDGGVLVDRGRIMAVDRYSRLRPEAARVVELEGRIITPALINCHCHLELSSLAGLGQDGSVPAGDMTAWIRLLLAKREAAVDQTAIRQAGEAALAEQHRRGVALVADIGNQPASLASAGDNQTEVLFFQELLGTTAQAAQAVLAALSPAGEVNYTVHAPYSCHPRLITAVKERSCRLGGLFPIHVAESADEIEFLQTGRGRFRDFLAERLTLAGVLAPAQDVAELVSIPGCGSIEYLHRLGALDHRTICVHSVHISAAEADMIATAQAKVSLCPGSNRRLGVGKAPLPLLLERQIRPGLGTDSLASNDRLDLWQEMMVLQSDHVRVSPELIFSMATRGGAETLAVAHRLGTLAPGREAKLLAVAFDGAAPDVYPFLVNSGEAIDVEWLETGHDE